MSEKIKTGGPAFPLGSTQEEWANGMTLRDYFASKTLQGLLANPETNRNWGVYDNAKYAYQQADAMIYARGEDE